jgi:hypothetical protein
MFGRKLGLLFRVSGYAVQFGVLGDEISAVY